MKELRQALLNLKEPEDYFQGIGNEKLPTPMNILLFFRPSREKLQQEAPQNRSHHRFVLIFNLKTPGCVHVNHLSLRLHPRQALLLHPYQFHHFSHLASNQLMWLICTFELPNDSLLEPLRNQVVDVSRRSEEARNSLLHEWIRCSEPERPTDLQAAQLQAVLTRLLLCLRQDHQAAAGIPPSEEPVGSLIQRVNRQLLEWHEGSMTVGDLAVATGQSESRLRILFKETAGIPLGGYIQNYRINRAMELLKTSRISIADVAEAAGFGSPQAFCRTFKKQTGKTPRTYRQRT